MAQKKAASRSKKAASRKKSSRSSSEGLERYNKGVEAFERAIKTLHKGDIEKARGQFETILSGFPEERELTDRAQSFMNICDRKTRIRRTHTPKDIESTVAHGVYLHNKGDYESAVGSLEKAVEMDPKNDHAHYCLAAAYARSGDARSATRHLKRAISTDPYNRVLAMTDTDFDSLRSDPTLTQILAEEVTETTQ
jgi:tetratricopeptide (TPR) repeat protein